MLLCLIMLMFIVFYIMELLELITISSISILSLWYWCVPLMPNIADIEQVIRRPYIRVLDNKGEALASYGDFYATPIVAEQLPDFIIHALLDTEDKRFYQHNGFDIFGIFRAFILNMQAGRITQGGSTLTQQLGKNFLISKKIFHTYDQSIQRKIYEVIIAKMLEQKYTKKQILSFYLNRVYFGAGTFGIAAAAEKFFDKKPNELNIYEAAKLVGMIQAPSRYVANPEQADKRAKHVLSNMVAQQHLSVKEKEMALLLAKQTNKNTVYGSHRFFTDWIINCVPIELYLGVNDITIHTTLDAQIQEIGHSQASKIMSELGPAWQAETVALLSCTLDGAITAMIGGADYRLNQFNNVTQAIRQPGSTFKILVYLTAFENGFSSSSLISDAPVEYKNWKPQNYEKEKYKYQGLISLSTAFAKSNNMVSVRLTDIVKPKRIIKMAKRLGINSAQPNDLTIGLGTGDITMLEFATPLLTIANQGDMISPYAITKIVNTQTKEILYKHPQHIENIVLKGEVVNNILDLLEANTEYGTGRNAKFDNHPIMGKTGTTQKERDKWFVGFSAHAVTLVRISTNKQGMSVQPNHPIHVLLWKHFMQEVHKQKEYESTEIYGAANEDDPLNKEDYQELIHKIATEKMNIVEEEKQKDLSQENNADKEQTNLMPE